MTWLLWHQQRRQAVLVAAALACVGVFLVVTGVHLAATYHDAVAGCLSSRQGCGELANLVFQGDNRLFDVVIVAGFGLPFVLGLFWGAPLIAHELEEGTHRLIWTQSVTRRRWLAVRLAWVLGAAAALTGLLCALLTWWWGPVNAGQLGLVHTGLLDARYGILFDVQGVVPIAYAVFAVALGVAAGLLLRRTLPAMATTLAVLGVTRYLFGYYVRPHLLPGRTVVLSANAQTIPGPAALVIQQKILNAAGRALPGGKVALSEIPAACHPSFYAGNLGPCLAAHGFHLLVDYQPAAHYWALQGIEAAIFIAAAGVLVAFSLWWLDRRDA